MGHRFKVPGARSIIVHQPSIQGEITFTVIICVATDFVEWFDGNWFIRSFEKWTPLLKFPRHTCKPPVHISGMTSKTLIAKFGINIRIIGIDCHLFHSRNNRNSAEICEEGMINLNIPESSLIKVCNFSMNWFCDVSEISRLRIICFVCKRIFPSAKVELFKCTGQLSRDCKGVIPKPCWYIRSHQQEHSLQ